MHTISPPSPMLQFTCQCCSGILAVPVAKAGVTGPCPFCHGIVTAPAASVAEPGPRAGQVTKAVFAKAPAVDPGVANAPANPWMNPNHSMGDRNGTVVLRDEVRSSAKASRAPLAVARPLPENKDVVASRGMKDAVGRGRKLKAALAVGLTSALAVGTFALSESGLLSDKPTKTSEELPPLMLDAKVQSSDKPTIATR